ncbi:MAG: hypothetical protein Q8O39_01680 [bacterium]|nr:hypothetical protein [bacterium]
MNFEKSISPVENSFEKPGKEEKTFDLKQICQEIKKTQEKKF